MKKFKVEVPVCGAIMGLHSTVIVSAKDKIDAAYEAVRFVNRGGHRAVYRAVDKCRVTEIEDCRESVRRFHLCEGDSK